MRFGRGVGRPRTCPSRSARTRRTRRGRSAPTLDLAASRLSKAVIRKPDDQKGHRRRRASRGGRPVSYDRADYDNRNVIERAYCDLKQWRGPDAP